MFGNNEEGFGGAELGDLKGYGNKHFVRGATGKTNLHFVTKINIICNIFNFLNIDKCFSKFVNGLLLTS